MRQFQFEPASYIPFRDKEVLAHVRSIKREDFEKHSNPDFSIKVVPDSDMEMLFVTDMFRRIKESDDRDEKCVMILPNPNPSYCKVAHLINECGISCRNLVTFCMDEWADEAGNIAPESYPQGFAHAFHKLFINQIRKGLRPPENQIHYFTNENVNSYSQMIIDQGEADVCYSGPGWTAHLAFIEPDAPEFKAESLDEWLGMGARLVTLNPFTVAQNSLHGSFGASGDMANVPPRAATIGPRDVMNAKARFEMQGISTAGSFVAWQRIASRLSLHGPVTPQIPTSMLQLTPTTVYVSETIAADIQPHYDFQY